MKKNILIDTDMGNDDILAINYLLLKEQYNIVGISTVNGVATDDNGFININRVLQFLDKKISICAGSQKAIKENDAKFPEYDTFRANNLILLRELSLPINNTVKCARQVEDFIYENTKNNTLILALGPLTNIAKTIKRYRGKFTSKISGIFMMGGGLGKGNVPPLFAAEYNIFLDPEAAAIVFSSNIAITMVGIDAASYVPVNRAFTKKIQQTKPTTKEGKIIKEIIVKNNKDFSLFYDPLSVYLLSNPGAIKETLQTGMDVIQIGRERGKTIPTMQKSNVNVVLSVDADAFYNEFLQALERNYYEKN